MQVPTYYNLWKVSIVNTKDLFSLCFFRDFLNPNISCQKRLDILLALKFLSAKYGFAHFFKFQVVLITNDHFCHKLPANVRKIIWWYIEIRKDSGVKLLSSYPFRVFQQVNESTRTTKFKYASYKWFKLRTHLLEIPNFIYFYLLSVLNSIEPSRLWSNLTFIDLVYIQTLLRISICLLTFNSFQSIP